MIYENVSREFELYENDEGELELLALCGSIGMYEVKLVLNDEENDQYKTKGNSFIDDLVTKIRKEESKFISRFI